jgi:hypothetical protein
LLPILTYSADLIEMAACLWLAFYLFARGYSNRVTMRLVITLMALAAFFLHAYHNYFFPSEIYDYQRAVLLVIALTGWYDATFHLLPQEQRTKWRLIEYGVYLLSFSAAVSLIAHPEVFYVNVAVDLYVGPMLPGLTFILYGSTLSVCSVFVPINILANKRALRTPHGRFLIFAASFPILLTIYKGITLLAVDGGLMPRVIQDTATFSGVFIMSISMARYQSMVERRTILEELPLTTALVAGSALIFGFLDLRAGLPLSSLANMTALVITAIGVYDLGREFLDRRRMLGKNQFRRQLRTIDKENNQQDKVQRLLQDGLDLLCDTLQAAGGVVAVYQDGKAVVTASRNSVRVGAELAVDSKNNGALWHPEESIPNIEWMSSIYEGQNQIALVGLGTSKTKMDYSSGDLELFVEFADHAGTIVSIGNLLPTANPTAEETEEINSAAEEMLRTVSDGVELELVKMVEDALRKFSDFIVLGQSPLAERILVDGETHLERGKQLQNILREAVDALHPGGAHPVEDPIPRVWYSYLVLYEAYVRGVPNRDIMARLYISKGTFDRTRRGALRGVARWMAEKFVQN